MKRQRRAVRAISAPVNGVYTDRTVVAVGGGTASGHPERPIVKLRVVVHDQYHLVERITPEALEDGYPIPKHDRVFTDPYDFTFHFLRKTR
jgi:hypothetical protein